MDLETIRNQKNKNFFGNRERDKTKGEQDEADFENNSAIND